MSNEKITMENLATFKEYNDKVYATKLEVKQEIKKAIDALLTQLSQENK